MTITNEEQAQAARKKLDALKEYAEAFGLPFSYGKFDTPTRVFNAYDSCSEEVQLRAALAAYEQRKAMQFEGLDEVTKARLVLWGMTDEESAHSTQFLRERGWLDQNDCAIKSIGTDYRAYLEAHKPRELKWEVHNKTDRANSFRCALDDFREARIVAGMYEKLYDGVTYEVREVK